MNERRLRTVTRTQGNNLALKDATVVPSTLVFDFEEVPVLVDAFRRMVRGLEFDVCEMALTTYICARSFGKRFTALPIPLVRAFHHGAIQVNANAGITHPKDLEGRRVGVNRGYTVTTGLWARSVLQDEYGVDLSRVTWVLSGDEHVAEYRPPSNVVPIEAGRKMSDLLVAGDLAAAIGSDVEHPDVRPLIADAASAGLHALRSRGHYPINHVVVVRDELLADDPRLGADIFQAFADAKRIYLERLAADRIEKPTAVDELHRSVMQIIGDPLPYGIDPNRPMLQAAIDHCIAQRIITERVAVDDLFDRGTYGLTA